MILRLIPVVTNNSGGYQWILDGGIARDTIVNSGGGQDIWNGGSAVSTTQYEGGNVNVYVVSGDSTYVAGTNASGQEFLLQSGVASNFILYAGGYQRVYSGGVASNTIVNSNSQQLISSGGIANNTTLINGAYQHVSNGGSANNTTASTNGYQFISNGGIANDTVISGGRVWLYEGGIMNNLTATGGDLDVVGDNTLSGNINLTNAHVHTYYPGTATNIENLSASNATFSMYVNLEDQTAVGLNIMSSYEGDSVLALRNTAATAQETTGDGINLVHFEDGATVDGTFDLAGGQWDEGGYI